MRIAFWLAAGCVLLAQTPAHADMVVWVVNPSQVADVAANGNLTNLMVFHGINTSGVQTVGGGAEALQLYRIDPLRSVPLAAFQNTSFGLPFVVTESLAVNESGTIYVPGVPGALASDTLTLHGTFSPTGTLTFQPAGTVLGMPGDLHQYTFELLAANLPTSSDEGSIWVNVTVTPANVSPLAAPEPASLVLAGLAAPGLLLVRNSRARRRAGTIL